MFRSFWKNRNWQQCACAIFFSNALTRPHMRIKSITTSAMDIMHSKNMQLKVWAVQDELADPKDLKIILDEVRSYLAELSKSNALTVTVTKKQKLTTYYGPKWIKYPRHACFYFHEGFSDEPTRDKHLLRNEKPFLCIDLNCPRKLWGYSTEKELKKHMMLEHPDPAAFEGKFPKIKKEPMKHHCDQCSSSFTRSSSLRIHQRTHSNERPFKCGFLVCPTAFVRRWDRDRHERCAHPGMVRASGSQPTQSDPTPT
ncbi:hypothetical protein SS1G_10344 [Sclerotinia sclerotiorum 1980 UF-70]|uniref:C2H2-type domain-containing protein n=1 Tax=Sclerotinia sclerotiorum (strain ATCC 18683 / 1980 / Ss-1) TaxID=665079 RepID=A7EYC9_SCLS1|nr:hypothetical protein SS1G_10344 [Sclerotinia sclerotiorum 1980 UF-70]EDN94471.1 hypothetical protein SS1G_10344 [Sclerotinia sclerotiorum 1980 UF-70]